MEPFSFEKMSVAYTFSERKGFRKIKSKFRPDPPFRSPTALRFLTHSYTIYDLIVHDDIAFSAAWLSLQVSTCCLTISLWCMGSAHIVMANTLCLDVALLFPHRNQYLSSGFDEPRTYSIGSLWTICVSHKGLGFYYSLYLSSVSLSFYPYGNCYL